MHKKINLQYIKTNIIDIFLSPGLYLTINLVFELLGLKYKSK